ncbi:MAG: hypothetical protein AVDCRST_MAG77-635 [uncultured Chloroflexi bacterium]|uniref:Uncharacterized protein n=1 Tax=uncultured Chloroflexota bacterium TaxID=166587 RepID=A0A6J4HJI7_9CHLR|nr:MAG: hypothetical protein AVDCRST_MAG77-635 [uncultured Chloroflexota bacterium]
MHYVAMSFVRMNNLGVAYSLHGETVTLHNSRPLPMFPFNRRLNPAAALDALPSGCAVAKKAGDGLPYLKRAVGDQPCRA